MSYEFVPYLIVGVNQIFAFVGMWFLFSRLSTGAKQWVLFILLPALSWVYFKILSNFTEDLEPEWLSVVVLFVGIGPLVGAYPLIISRIVNMGKKEIDPDTLE